MTRAHGAAAFGVFTWCLTVMAMGVGNARSAWEWIWTFFFGALAPVALLRLAASPPGSSTTSSATRSPAGGSSLRPDRDAGPRARARRLLGRGLG